MGNSCMATLAALLTMPVFAALDVTVPGDAMPIKDMSASGCCQGIGYNAALESVWGVGGDDWWFVSNKVETAAALKSAGANLLRLQCMNEWFGRRNSKDPLRRSNPRAAFDFYKANGIKVMVCLEVLEPWQVDQNVEIVRWIIDNGYKDVVAGVELGNETYWSSRYPEMAPRWRAFIDQVEEIWPGIPLGINLAEMFELNPDIKQVKARLMSGDSLQRDWSKEGAYFTVADFNRHTAQFVVAMSNHLDKVSHVIYHAYGAETPYSCSYYGFKRFRNFVSMFPQLKGKKFWITEARPRSDEDNHCQRQFREVLIMGHYALMALCQPETDCFNHHQLTCLSGAIFQSSGKSWYNQWYDGSQEELPDFTSPYSRPRMQVGAIGVAYRILGQGIRECPVFLAHGVSGQTGTESDWCASARLADQVYARRRALKEGRDSGFWGGLFGGKSVPEVEGDVEWILATSKERDKYCLMAVNSKSEEVKLNLSIDGFEYAAPTYRTISCPEEYLDCCEIPGEEHPWKAVGWEDTVRGFWFADMSGNKGLKPQAETLPITVKPHSVQTVTFRARRVAKAERK